MGDTQHPLPVPPPGAFPGGPPPGHRAAGPPLKRRGAGGTGTSAAFEFSVGIGLSNMPVTMS